MRCLVTTLSAIACLLLALACGVSDGSGSEGPSTESDCSDGLDEDTDGLADCEDPDCGDDPTCRPSPERDCSNAEDDDGDEQTDCDDSDCSTDPACNRPPRNEAACENRSDDDADGDVDCADHDCVVAPACGGTSPCELGTCCYRGTTTVSFPQDVLEGSLTSGDSSDGPRGPEHHFDDIEFAGVAGEAARIEVTSAEFDSYLYLLDDNCEILVADDDTGAELLSSISFTLPRTGVYTVVVTSFDATATGDYVLTLSPTTPTRETNCDDLVDNDADGNADCDDLDCITTPGCDPQVGAESVCDDNRDDDRDGEVDCQDSDCMVSPTCGGDSTCELATCCYSGLDTVAFPNDVYAGSLSTEDQIGGPNGATTNYYFDDIEFAGAANYAVRIEVVEAQFDPMLYLLDEDCSQLAYNDDSGGGLLPEITVTIPRTGVYTVVVTSYDRERTGEYVLRLTDTTPDSEALCEDGVDNDVDDLTDCDDPDCAGTPECGEFVCDDGRDNDSDGAVDCDDPDCGGTPACFESVCNDLLDNDGDGAVDCDDSDCADTAPNCLGTCEVGTCCLANTGVLVGPTDTSAGTLAETDSRVGPTGAERYYDEFEFTASADDTVTLETTSASFDSALYLLDSSCTTLAADSDGGADTLSLVTYSLPSTGVYAVVVTSIAPAALGTYELRMSLTSED